MLTLFVNVFMKLFMILTPFFVVSAFLSLTRDDLPAERHRIALKVTLAVAVSCFVLFWFGTYIFALPGSNGAVRDGWDNILAEQLDSRNRPCNFVELMPRLREV